MSTKTDDDLAADRQRGRLLRVLGIGFGLAVTIGNTIGAGILRTPGEVAAQLPNPWLFIGVWIVGGLYAMLGALSLAELGTMIPRSGGQYVFARRALGEYAGFIVGWSDWISTCGSTAAVAIVIGEYTSVLFPALAQRAGSLASAAARLTGSSLSEQESQSIPLALAVAVLFALLQWRGIVWGSLTQNFTSLLKALAFIALIAACFIFGANHAVAATQQPLMPSGLPFFVALIVALQGVIFAYDGWTGIIYFSEEVRNPARDIPRSLFGSLFVITAIYLLINLAFLHVLPLSSIAGQTLAAGAAAQAVFGEYGDTIIRALTIIALLSSVNALHLLATRVLFALSRDRLFSESGAKVNKGGTPAVALFISTLVTVLFIWKSRTFEKVIAVLAFFFVANYIISFISVFVLRRREPDAPRPYRVPGYPWTTALALAGSIAFLVGAVASDTRNSIYALLLLGVSYPAFLLLKWLAKS